MRVRPAVLVFGGPALVVVLVSAAMTMHRSEAAMRPQPARFSGSTVVQRLPSLLASPRLAEQIDVVVVRDAAAASFYTRPGELDAIVARWRDALAAIGASVRVLSPDAALDDRAARVFVVPSSPCLSVATRELLDSTGGRDAGVILTGAAGVADGGCWQIGYGLIIGATGAARADVLEQREMTYVTFPSATVFSADIPPGARLDLRPGRQVALRTRRRDAFYSDYSLQPQPSHREPLLDAALTHANFGGRRVVYWGFELIDVVARPWDREIARLLVRNSVAWAAQQTTATIEPWPRGKRAAASIAQDVESGFANARYAVDSLRAAGVRSTFYLTSDLAERYERLSHRLAESGEIGTHSENHRLLGGLTGPQQRTRLATTQRQIRAIVGSEVNGLRPPEEQFDTATMRAWLAVGGKYLFGANDSRAAAPELLRVDSDTLALVGRVGSDDFAAARRSSMPDTVAAILLREYERVRALGGHYVLSYHSQVLARPDLVPALAQVARRLAADSGVWVATVGEVADWWRVRAQLRARTIVSGSRLQVSVRNGSDQTAHGVVVRVTLPDSRRAVYSDAKILAGSARSARVLMPPIPPHATKAIAVVLVGPR
jgi:peptidoglycan/xylan/chitin deacetylase (PgdA/CDA1 family)